MVGTTLDKMSHPVHALITALIALLQLVLELSDFSFQFSPTLGCRL
jgi:hypothetical protein